MRTRSVGLHDAPYAKVLRHLPFLPIFNAQWTLPHWQDTTWEERQGMGNLLIA
jgi:hypothetical protein